MRKEKQRGRWAYEAEVVAYSGGSALILVFSAFRKLSEARPAS